MDATPAYQGLARWVQQILQTGLSLNDDLNGYMESTFGRTDLTRILAEADSNEIDSLLELLFYPDIGLQIQYETQWGHIPFTDQDQRAVIELLQSEPLQVPILLQDKTPAMRIDVPDFVIASFIQRLNIACQPPADLTAVLERNLGNRLHMLTRVHLRNVSFSWQPQQVDLMHLFVNRMADHDDYETCLTFILSIIQEFGPQVQPYAFLAAKKFFYFQSLCKAEAFERKRQTSNMETLLLQGERSSHGSIEEWRSRMHRIDRICQALFGRTEFYHQPLEHHLDFQNKDNGQDLESVFRMLN